jgi:diacylglycerol kinase
MNQGKFSIKKRLHSFKYAFNGLQILIKEEHNSRVHLFASFIVIAAGLFFKISSFEWIAVVFAIGLVIALEIVNSAIENVANFI